MGNLVPPPPPRKYFCDLRGHVAMYKLKFVGNLKIHEKFQCLQCSLCRNRDGFTHQRPALVNIL